MKVIYKFDMSNEDDREDIKLFQATKRMYYVLSAFANDRRHKYAEKSDDWWTGFDEARRIFFEICEEQSLKLDELE